MPTIMAPQLVFDGSGFPVYGIGVFLGVASFIIMLLIIPPFCWHWRNGNIGATFFIGWTVVLLLFSFINEVIWPSDDIASWWNGIGLCDIEVKIQVASQVGFPAAFCCILKALACILDTERVTMETEAQRRRGNCIDLFICIFPALLEMVFAFVVQPARYFILGMSGCTVSTDGSWLAIVLVNGISGLWILADALLAGKSNLCLKYRRPTSDADQVHESATDVQSIALILIRLYRYRLNFSSILASTNTSKSRFLRLYLICVVWIIASTAVWCYDLWWNLIYNQSTSAFSWSETHNPATWNTIYEEPSMGVVLYDRWICVVAGFMIFVFFGFGKEATRMYRSVLGLAHFFPSLPLDNRDSSSCGSQSPSILLRLHSKLFSKCGSRSGSAGVLSIDEMNEASTAKSPALVPVAVSELDVLTELRSFPGGEENGCAHDALDRIDACRTPWSLRSSAVAEHSTNVVDSKFKTQQAETKGYRNEDESYRNKATDAKQQTGIGGQDVVSRDRSIFVRMQVIVEEDMADGV